MIKQESKITVDITKNENKALAGAIKVDTNSLTELLTSLISTADDFDAIKDAIAALETFVSSTKTKLEPVVSWFDNYANKDYKKTEEIIKDSMNPFEEYIPSYLESINMGSATTMMIEAAMILNFNFYELKGKTYQLVDPKIIC